MKGLKTEYRNQTFYLELLTKEFELGVKMEYPHIAHTFSKETDPLAGPCIVMEYVDGVTLRESLDRTPPYSRERHTKIVNDIVKQCPACESCRSKLEQYVEQSNLNHHTDFSGAVLAFWEEKKKVAY